MIPGLFFRVSIQGAPAIQLADFFPESTAERPLKQNFDGQLAYAKSKRFNSYQTAHFTPLFAPLRFQ